MTCSRIDCEADAQWRPVLLIYASAGGPHIRIEIGIGLCGQHRAETTRDDILTDQSWDQIVQTVAGSGRVAPVRALTELAFTRLS